MNGDLVEMSTQELRSTQVELLRCFDELCRTHHIRYALGFGTLLGAVRHGGFIPWDDDIDVAVPRPDYDRLVEIRHLFEDENHSLRVNSGGEDTYPYPYAKFEDRRTVLVEHSAAAVPLGVNIDVFPLDAAPGTPFRRWIHLKALRVGALILTVKGWTPRPDRGIKDKLARSLQRLISPVHAGQFARALTRTARLPRFDEKRTGGVLVWGPQSAVPLEWWASSGRLPFETQEFPGPANPDGILTATYGAYMELPPPEERVTHHDFTAYRRTAGGAEDV